MQYKILEGNMERLEKKLTRIYNKCKKYGCQFSYNKIGEEFAEITDSLNVKHTVKFIIIDVKGLAKVNDWRFIGSIEQYDTGNVIKVMDYSIEIPIRYYDCKLICEHCGNKNVKKTYLIYNDSTKEFKQVGKTCLQDFTRGMSAEYIANYISLFDEIILMESPYEGYSFKDYFNIIDYLMITKTLVDKFGYVKNDEDNANAEITKYKAYDYYMYYFHLNRLDKRNREYIKNEIKKNNFEYDTEENKEYVENALKWIQNKAENNNLYLHNLKIICSKEYAEYKDLGLLCSLIPSYYKEIEKIKERIEKEEKKQDNNSIFVGKIGDRISIEAKEISVIASWETEYGITKVYRIIDTLNNEYIWKTTKYIDNEVKMIKGTVKEHKEFNGIKQTEITRCKIVA